MEKEFLWSKGSKDKTTKLMGSSIVSHQSFKKLMKIKSLHKLDKKLFCNKDLRKVYNQTDNNSKKEKMRILDFPHLDKVLIYFPLILV